MTEQTIQTARCCPLQNPTGIHDTNASGGKEVSIFPLSTHRRDLDFQTISPKLPDPCCSYCCVGVCDEKDDERGEELVKSWEMQLASSSVSSEQIEESEMIEVPAPVAEEGGTKDCELNRNTEMSTTARYEERRHHDFHQQCTRK